MSKLFVVSALRGFSCLGRLSPPERKSVFNTSLPLLENIWPANTTIRSTSLDQQPLTNVQHQQRWLFQPNFWNLSSPNPTRLRQALHFRISQSHKLRKHFPQREKSHQSSAYSTDITPCVAGILAKQVKTTRAEGL